MEVVMRLHSGISLFLLLSVVCACISCFTPKSPKTPTVPQSVSKIDPVEEPPNGQFEMSDVTPGELDWSASGVRVNGHYAWVMSEYSGIQIFDVSNPAKPVWIKNLDIKQARDVVFINGYAYISSGIWQNSRFVVVDCDPVESVKEIASLPLAGNPGNIYITGSTVCLPLYGEGLAVIHVSNPEAPHMGKFIADKKMSSHIAVDDGYAYAVVDQQGLRIFDIDPPVDTHSVNFVPLDVNGSSDIAVSDGYAYISEYRNGIYLVDVRTPESANLVSTVSMPMGAEDIEISGNYLYISDDSNGLQIMDISPGVAHLVASCPTAGHTNKLEIADQRAYLKIDPSSIQIADISNPASPVTEGIIRLPQFPVNYTINDGYLYATDSDLNLQIADVRNPRSPRIVYGSDSMKGSQDVDVSGNYAYVCEGKSLKILDITSPESPSTINSVPIGWPVSRIVVSGGYAWVASVHSYGNAEQDPGLALIDIDPVSTAHMVKSFTEFGTINDMAIDGKYLYLGANEDGLRIVDIKQPESPALVNTVPSSNFFSDQYHKGAVYGVGISDGIAVAGLHDNAISEWFGSLGVVNIDPPEQAHVVGTVGINDAKRIMIKDGYAYTASGMFGFLVYDIDPADKPQLISSLYSSPPGEIVLAQMEVGPPRNGVAATCIDIAGKYVYVGGGADFHVFYVTNSPTLTDVAALKLLGGATGLDVSGRYAYIACGWAGLRIIKLW
jgi:hypothetical protein